MIKGRWTDDFSLLLLARVQLCHLSLLRLRLKVSVYSHLFIYWLVYVWRRAFPMSLLLSVCPSAKNFPLLQSVYVVFFSFWLLGVEQTNLCVCLQQQHLLLHYFHPCLRLGQQFRIPQPSQTSSVLKRADATTSASPLKPTSDFWLPASCHYYYYYCGFLDAQQVSPSVTHRAQRCCCFLLYAKLLASRRHRL